MSESFKDRRQYVRIYRNFILSYHEKDKADVKYDISQVNNISKGGLCFVATRSFAPGAVIGIHLRTPFITDSVYMEGKVLNTAEKIAGLIYEVRIQFDQLAPQALDVLDKIERYNVQQGNP